ncbi:MAG: outer membrane protein assembly factor BamA [Oligoflexales bacterium]|nr:outer membrane protein assembly factor BamA [Oligoflexales bacterium]
MKKSIVLLMPLLFLFEVFAMAKEPEVVEIIVRGNSKVESDAILATIGTVVGKPIVPSIISKDIKKLYELGYFSEIHLFKKNVEGGIRLIIEVKEKPSIMEIKFVGLEEITEEDLSKKLQTKKYTIVNEATITNDLRLIEKQYLEKGFYLAQATYTLEKIKDNENEVTLTYNVKEGGKVQVGSIDILGNKYFTTSEIISKFMSKPLTRTSAFSSPGSVYLDEMVNRDVEALSYFYKDFGFAEVKVSKPVQVMDSSWEFVRITMEVEEGIQYNVGSIDVSGDLLYTKEELFEWMKLKPGELFRFSKFRADVEMLIDKYGDKGYAFVDVNPKHVFDREKKIVHLNYEITKGEKIYFGEMTIVGNTKSRDNVIRREVEVADSELYSGTKLTSSKQNIERLGFFEEVQTIRQRDEKEANVLNYKFKVKEKPTGQLQAAVGFSPGSTAESNWFGQGSYREENQSGKAWKVNLTGKWNGGRNYSLETGITDPRVNDSKWSLGFGASWQHEIQVITDGVNVEEKRIDASVTVGRDIIEKIRGFTTYKISKITQNSDAFLLDRFTDNGIESSLILGLSRNTTNNYLDPTEGNKATISQQITGGKILRGDSQYLESLFSDAQYIPIDFTETYRTYLRFYGVLGLLNTYEDKPIPFSVRYRMGGPMDLRAYGYKTIGPKYNILQAPGDMPKSINYGGTKKLLFQIEYFFPIIQEANIKGLFFTDFGKVYRDDENIELKKFTHDVGFGFRWITPIAPFRFEWAYPYENGKLGDMEFVFYLGF